MQRAHKKAGDLNMPSKPVSNASPPEDRLKAALAGFLVMRRQAPHLAAVRARVCRPLFAPTKRELKFSFCKMIAAVQRLKPATFLGDWKRS